MYGPGSQQGGGGKVGGGRGGGGGRERMMTPRGSMSGANQRPPLMDLPPHMKAMFEPRAPLPHGQPRPEKKLLPYTGVSALVDLMEKGPPPQRIVQELPKERKARLAAERQRLNDEKNALMLQDYDPKNNYKATENAFSTLFVARLSYETSERKLKREFEQFGAVKEVKIITDKDGKPRGYAFIEFEREGDMAEAYRRANGRKIDGRRVVVDVERGRTVKGWRPRRFGGGLGGRKAKKSKKELALEEIRNAAAFAAASSDMGGDARVRREERRGEDDRRRPDDRRRNDRDRDRDRERDRDRDRDRDRGRDRGDRNDRSSGGRHYGPSNGGGGSYYGPPSGGEKDRDRDRDRNRDRSDRKRSRSRSPAYSSSRRRY